MKKIALALGSILFLLFGCEPITLLSRREPLEDLTVTLRYNLMSEIGPAYEFQFRTQQFEYQYNLVFNTIIHGDTLTIELLEPTVDRKCIDYPGWGNPDFCSSRETVLIPDADLPPGDYHFQIITPEFESNGTFTRKLQEIFIDFPDEDHINVYRGHACAPRKGYLLVSLAYYGEKTDTLLMKMLEEINLPEFKETSFDSLYFYCSMSGVGSWPQDTSYLEYDFLRIYEKQRAYQYPAEFSLQQLKPTIVKYYSELVYGQYLWNHDWRIIFQTTEGEEVRFGYREPIKLTFIE